MRKGFECCDAVCVRADREEGMISAWAGWEHVCPIVNVVERVRDGTDSNNNILST